MRSRRAGRGRGGSATTCWIRSHASAGCTVTVLGHSYASAIPAAAATAHTRVARVFNLAGWVVVTLHAYRPDPTCVWDQGLFGWVPCVPYTSRIAALPPPAGRDAAVPPLGSQTPFWLRLAAALSIGEMLSLYTRSARSPLPHPAPSSNSEPALVIRMIRLSTSDDAIRQRTRVLEE